jgi:hypothetical protein
LVRSTPPSNYRLDITRCFVCARLFSGAYGLPTDSGIWPLDFSKLVLDGGILDM